MSLTGLFAKRAAVAVAAGWLADYHTVGRPLPFDDPLKLYVDWARTATREEQKKMYTTMREAIIKVDREKCGSPPPTGNCIRLKPSKPSAFTWIAPYNEPFGATEHTTGSWAERVSKLISQSEIGLSAIRASKGFRAHRKLW